MNINKNPFYLFVERNIKAIHKDGLPALLVMLRKLIIYLPIGLLALPVILLIRLLHPLCLIRFGALINERIGHYAGNTELYLCEKDADLNNTKAIDIFYNGSPITCNYQLKKMWERTLLVSRYARWFDLINQMIPGGEKHIIPLPSDRDTKCLFSRFKTHLIFTPEEETIGKQYLESKGLNNDTKFVCFYSRDTAYLDTIFRYPAGTWSYHNYRNSSIHGQIPAVQALVKRGHYAFRMGSVVEDALNINNKKIIDYTTNGDRTDFLDIYLCAKCHFFLCGEGGLAVVPYVFRKPIVAVNQIPLQYCPISLTDLFIPKKLWWKEKGRFMTFTEIFNTGAGRFLQSQDYERLGIECIENTTEEITAVALEMDERLKGLWKSTEEDEALQKRFQSIFPISELHGKTRSRIGADFLIQNRKLLE